MVVAPWLFRVPGFRRFRGYATRHLIVLKHPAADEDLVVHGQLCHVWQLQFRALRVWLSYARPSTFSRDRSRYRANRYEVEARQAVELTRVDGQLLFRTLRLRKAANRGYSVARRVTPARAAALQQEKAQKCAAETWAKRSKGRGRMFLKHLRVLSAPAVSVALIPVACSGADALADNGTKDKAEVTCTTFDAPGANEGGVGETTRPRRRATRRTRR